MWSSVCDFIDVFCLVSFMFDICMYCLKVVVGFVLIFNQRNAIVMLYEPSLTAYIIVLNTI